ncbi:MAG: DUF1573 domain-containing protein [Calditrichia bacterium]
MRFNTGHFLFIFLLFASTAFSQKFELITPKVMSLGEIPSDTLVESVIKFRNAGEKPLQIKDVKTSCGCTVVSLDKLVYEKGEEGEIPVLFNSKGYSGTTRKSVSIYLKDHEPEVEKVILQITINPQIDIKPRFINLQDVSVSDKEVVRVIEIVNNTGKPLSGKLDPNDAKGFGIKPQQINVKPHSSESVTVTYQPAETGRKDTYLVLDVSKPFSTKKRIPVFINIRE